MTRSNRILNRALILLVGVVAIAAGLALELPTFSPRLGLQTPKLAVPSDDVLWIVFAACVAVVVLSLLWMFTRGRGRTSELLVLGDPNGSITVDARVAGDLIADGLADHRDIASVGSGSYRMRGQRVLSLRVVIRPSADLPGVIRDVAQKIDELDVVLERRFPVLLQVVAGR